MNETAPHPCRVNTVRCRVLLSIVTFVSIVAHPSTLFAQQADLKLKVPDIIEEAEKFEPTPDSLSFKSTMQTESSGFQHEAYQVAFSTRRRGRSFFRGQWDLSTQAELHRGSFGKSAYGGQKAVFGIGRDIGRSGYHVDLQGGYHKLSYDSNEIIAELPIVKGSFAYYMGYYKHVKLGFGQDLVYQDWVSQESVRSAVWQRGGSLAFEDNQDPVMHTKLSGGLQFLNDGNLLQNQEASVLFRISDARPRLFFGAGVNHMAFADPVPGLYWSPVDYFAFGPRVEVNVPIVGALNVHANGNLNRSKEANQNPTLDHYYQIGLDYKSELFEISADLIGMGNLPRYGTWARSDINVSASAKF